MLEKKKASLILCILILSLLLFGCQSKNVPAETGSVQESTEFIDQNTEFDGGSGTITDPYQVASAEQLDKIRENLDANYILIDDIDLSDVENWEPIGIYDLTAPEDDPSVFAQAFAGTLDGNSHEISNLNIQNENGVGVGLFGVTSDQAIIKNLSVKNSECSGMMAVSVVVGYNCGTVENVKVSGDVSVNGYNCVGGVIGGNMGGSVSACRAENVNVTILGETDFSDDRYVLSGNNQCGGLIIGGSFGGTIFDCDAQGEVYAKGQNVMGLGGIAGCLENMPSIVDCTADVIIHAGKDAHGIGGLCGFSGTFGTAAQISDCSVNSVIQCEENATHVGGLIGTGLYMGGNESIFEVKNCSVTAEIVGAVNPGAIAGRADGSRIENCETNVVFEDSALSQQVGQEERLFESAE